MTTALAAWDLTLQAGGRTLLANGQLSVEAGGCLAVLGATGCGKSTLIRALCGLHPCGGGQVRVGQVSSATQGFAAVRRQLGVLLALPALVDGWTVETNTAWGLLRAGVGPAEATHRAHAMLAEVGLAHAGPLLPHQLSGGMQRRAALARALVHNPAGLLLDDPTAGLDPITAAEVLALVLSTARHHGAAVVLTTHDLPRVASHATAVLLMRNSSLQPAQGGPPQWAAALAA